jgi:hypothetical protein
MIAFFVIHFAPVPPASKRANPRRATCERGSIRVFCPETAVVVQNVNRLFTVAGKKLRVDEGPSPVSTRR